MYDRTTGGKNIARIVLYLSNITFNKRCNGPIRKCTEVCNDFLPPDCLKTKMNDKIIWIHIRKSTRIFNSKGFKNSF